MEYFWQYNNQADQNNQAGRNYEKLRVVISEKTSENSQKIWKNWKKSEKIGKNQEISEDIREKTQLKLSWKGD